MRHHRPATAAALVTALLVLLPLGILIAKAISNAGPGKGGAGISNVIPFSQDEIAAAAARAGAPSPFGGATPVPQASGDAAGVAAAFARASRAQDERFAELEAEQQRRADSRFDTRPAPPAQPVDAPQNDDDAPAPDAGPATKLAPGLSTAPQTSTTQTTPPAAPVVIKTIK
jgi:hypothetical protein